jgi:ketosteroid isomerase-like protein
MTDLDKSLAHLMQAYTDAVWAQDVTAFMRLYDPQVRVFDAWGVWSYEGADAWQTAVEGWLRSLGTERVRVQFEDVSTLGDAGLMLVSAVVSYTAVSAAGEPLRTMHNRLSWGLRTKGHGLRIVHEHTSAPVGFEDMKAILQRPGGA